MSRTGKDVAATALTALVLVTFAATHESWNVALVGDSRRWAAVVITLLGIAACAQGDEAGRESSLLMALGITAGAISITAFVTGSLMALSLLVVATAALWALTTVRHVLAHDHHDRTITS